MIRAGRTQQVVEHETASGIPVHLKEQSWWVAAGGRRWGLAFGYGHPVLVEVGGARVRVRDHVGILRLLALAAILVTRLVARSAR